MNRNRISVLCIAMSVLLLAGCSKFGDVGVKAAPDTEPVTVGAGTGQTAEQTTGQPGQTTEQEPEQTAPQEDVPAGFKPTFYETVNNMDGMTMTVKKKSAEPTGLTFILENKSDRECLYGSDFWVEKKINDAWYRVPPVITNYGFTAIGYTLSPGKKKSSEVQWEWLFGSLPAGEYRFVKSVLDFRSTGDYDEYHLAAEFELN